LNHAGMIAYSYYLLIGVILFCLGVFLVITRKNAIMALMGIELMLNAANLNFVAFSTRDAADIDGQMIALFVIVLAAAEVAVALAIVLNLYRHYRTVNLDKVNRLKY
jgi:NADH-quinone oxidoreductase subunit K